MKCGGTEDAVESLVERERSEVCAHEFYASSKPWREMSARLLKHVLREVYRLDAPALDPLQEQAGEPTRPAACVNNCLIAFESKTLKYLPAPGELWGR